MGGFALNPPDGESQTMAEELQPLLDQHQKEAIDEADKKAAHILTDADAKAKKIVREAEETAAQAVKKAEENAQVFEERGKETLAQAGRNLILRVGEKLTDVFRGLAEKASGEAMNSDAIKEILVRMAEAYASRSNRQRKVEVLLNEQDAAALRGYFAQEFKSELVTGIDITVDTDVTKGFRVSLEDDKVFHDFTKEAIGEAMSAYLRPPLDKIVYGAAHELSGKSDTSPAE